MGQVTESLVLIGQDGPQLTIDQLLTEFDAEVVRVRPLPNLYRYAHVKSNVESFGDLPTLSLKEPAMVGWRGAMKRVSDILVAGSLLVVLAPALALIALIIRVTSKGPAMFYQTRMGVDGHTFLLVKFRTMYRDAERETGPIWARNHDPRCTRFGAFLRWTSLDELPQLWNVLRGEMSLVGPRPERPVFVEQFTLKYPTYMLRHSVKGGMTGWAQVNGWRGNTSLTARLEHDLYYVQNWSFALDIKTLYRTVFGGFLNKNAY